MGKAYEPRERKSKETAARKSDTTNAGVFTHKFINPYLDGKDKDWLSSNVESLDACVLELIQCVGDEYTLTVKYEPTSNRYNAMFKCVVDGTGNSNLILSVRAATPTDALYALYYLHVVKSDTFWRTITTESDIPASRWG